jgi:hypothetical protein
MAGIAELKQGSSGGALLTSPAVFLPRSLELAECVSQETCALARCEPVFADDLPEVLVLKWWSKA